MSIVKDALIEEIKEQTKLSLKYSGIMHNAKTETKRSIYRKRLSAHNNKLADLLISLDKLDKPSYNSLNNNKSGNENDANSEQDR